MAQAKRKQSTKTAKKPATRSTTRKKSSTRTAKCKGISNKERIHVYIVTAMSMITMILLCADIAMMIV